jgi:hypothetical protein
MGKTSNKKGMEDEIEELGEEVVPIPMAWKSMGGDENCATEVVGIA